MTWVKNTSARYWIRGSLNDSMYRCDHCSLAKVRYTPGSMNKISNKLLLDG